MRKSWHYHSVNTMLEKFENVVFTLKTHQMFSVHATPEEFDNGDFILKTHQMFSVHATSEEFDNGGFTLKTHQMFSVHTTPEEFGNATITAHFATRRLLILELWPWKTGPRKSRDCRDVIVFEKLLFQNVFPQSRRIQIPYV